MKKQVDIKELEKKYGKVEKVTLFDIEDKEQKDPCIFYLRPVNTHTKKQCLNLFLFENGKIKAAEMWLECGVIKEESDNRIFLQNDDNDNFYMGAVLHCLQKVSKIGGFVKKK